jgi:Cu+-exporting ATPase
MRTEHTHPHVHTNGPAGATVAEVVDPVCGMTIAPDDAAGRLTHHGHEYFFCSESCLERFRDDPERFLAPAAGPDPGLASVEHTCPMHPEVRQLGPGACPICGMALEPVDATAVEQGNPELDDMTRRFRVGLALTAPILGFMLSESRAVRCTTGSLPGCAPGSSWRWRLRSCCGAAGRSSSAAGPRCGRAI